VASLIYGGQEFIIYDTKFEWIKNDLQTFFNFLVDFGSEEVYNIYFFLHFFFIVVVLMEIYTLYAKK
jgi:hypothetical protein